MSDKEKNPEEHDSQEPENEQPPREEQPSPASGNGEETSSEGDAPALWRPEEPLAGEAPDEPEELGSATQEQAGREGEAEGTGPDAGIPPSDDADDLKEAGEDQEPPAPEAPPEDSWNEPIPLVPSEPSSEEPDVPPAEPKANVPEAAVVAAATEDEEHANAIAATAIPAAAAAIPQPHEPDAGWRPKSVRRRRPGGKAAAGAAGGALGVFSLAAWRRQWQSQKEYHAQEPPPFQTAGEAAKRAAGHLASPFNILQFLIFALLVGVFGWQASVHWQATLDDAYITFRFLDMFSQGFGWVYNPEGPRVEGFTTFLWPLLLLIPHWFGAELMFVAKVLGLASGVVAMAGAWALAATIRRRNDLFNLIPPALLAFSTWFSYWALAGMETQLQVALLALTYARFELERRDLRRWQISPVLGFLAIVTRVDSAFYLLPLALYAVVVLLRKEWPWARFRRAMVFGLLPVLLFWGWRYVYFGDWLPNTYYAKQVTPAPGEHPERGWAQLKSFYTSQPSAEAQPMQRSWLPGDGASTAAVYLDNATRFLPGTGFPSLLWTNLWVLAFLLSFAALVFAMLGLGSRGRLPRWEAILFLGLLPWGLSVYYVLHVNGDWMPSFRFFQVALLFIGVVAAIGFGTAAPMLRVFWAPRYGRWLFSLVSFVLFVYLMAGVAREQLRTKTTSIYSPDFTTTSARDSGWWHPNSVRASYGKGFGLALPEVAEFLLLNTQDDSWLFMGDIGFPLWVAPHLSLYDADGLTDKHIGHAPSARGRTPGPGDVLRDMLAAHEGPLGRSERNEIRERARHQFARMANERNARLIMEQRRPEYIAFHTNHPPGEPPPERGTVNYPGPSAEIRRHPDFQSDYVPLGSVRKTGDIRTHFFRRADVEAEVAVEARVERLLAAVERNPRVGRLYAILLDEAERLPEEAAELAERVHDAARRALVRLGGDREAVYPILNHLHDQGEDAYIQEVFEARLARNPADLAAARMLSDLHRANSDWDRAQDVLIEVLRKRPLNPEMDMRHLLWMARARDDKARQIEALGLLLALHPDSAENWYRLARLHQEQEAALPLPAAQRIEFLEAALTGYERAMELDPERYSTAEVMIQSVQRRLDEVARETRGIPPMEPAPEPEAVPEEEAQEEDTLPAETKPLDDVPPEEEIQPGEIPPAIELEADEGTNGDAGVPPTPTAPPAPETGYNAEEAEASQP